LRPNFSENVPIKIFAPLAEIFQLNAKFLAGVHGVLDMPIKVEKFSCVFDLFSKNDIFNGNFVESAYCNFQLPHVVGK